MSDLFDKTVILYSTGCPKCNVLKRKLDESCVKYTTEHNVDKMISLGISSAPALGVDGSILDFKQAVDWLRNRQGQIFTKQMVD